MGTSDYHPFGGKKTLPPTNLDMKMAYLNACIRGRHWEDVAGHLVDLLEFARQQLDPARAPFQNLEEMVRYYGRAIHVLEMKEDT